MASSLDDQVLRERARVLAAPLTLERQGAAADMLIVRLATERYGIDLRSLAAVLPVQGLAPVPCTPASIAGVMNVRGDILTIIHLGAALGLPSNQAAAATRVILVDILGGRVGLLVDEVLGVEALDLAALEPPLTERDFVRGISGGRTTIVDLAMLLTDQRFAVQDEVA